MTKPICASDRARNRRAFLFGEGKAMTQFRWIFPFISFPEKQTHPPRSLPREGRLSRHASPPSGGDKRGVCLWGRGRGLASLFLASCLLLLPSAVLAQDLQIAGKIVP